MALQSLSRLVLGQPSLLGKLIEPCILEHVSNKRKRMPVHVNCRCSTILAVFNLMHAVLRVGLPPIAQRVVTRHITLMVVPWEINS